MRRGDRIEHKVAVARHDPGRRRCAARKGYVHRLEAALTRQQRAAQMTGGTYTGRSIVQLAGVRPAIGDELRQVAYRQ